MPITRDDVEFTSRAATLRGWLYHAEGQQPPRPGIVLAHGMSAVREMFLDRYAEAFAAAGFVTLVYDHVGFGASDGEPRQSPVPSWQQAGYRDAVTWLAGQPSVDPERIGIWGSSYSGGEVIVLAAQDLPIRCAVAQVPVLGGGDGPAVSAATGRAIGEALRAGRLDDTIPVVSQTEDGLGLMYRDHAYDWFTRVGAERAPSWRNEITVRGFAEPFQPIESLAAVHVPLLLLVAPGDTLVPPTAGMPIARTNPMIELVELPGDHFSAYEAGFAQSSGLAVDWFARHLAGV